MAITPYYAILMDPQIIQDVLSANELVFRPGELADLVEEDASSPVPDIVHRYPDRVLFILTHKCSMYCMYCTRQRLVWQKDFSVDDEAIG